MHGTMLLELVSQVSKYILYLYSIRCFYGSIALGTSTSIHEFWIGSYSLFTSIICYSFFNSIRVQLLLQEKWKVLL